MQEKRGEERQKNAHLLNLSIVNTDKRLDSDLLELLKAHVLARVVGETLVSLDVVAIGREVGGGGCGGVKRGRRRGIVQS